MFVFKLFRISNKLSKIRCFLINHELTHESHNRATANILNNVVEILE